VSSDLVPTPECG